MPSVIQSISGENFTVYVYFSGGSIRHFDIKPLIEKGGVFSRLGDKTFFNEHLTVINHSVAWDETGDYNERKCIDIDPLVMYENASTIKDPIALGLKPSLLLLIQFLKDIILKVQLFLNFKKNDRKYL